MREMMVPLISSSVMGPLGVMHLPRLWLKYLLNSYGRLMEGYELGGGGFDARIFSMLAIDASAFAEYITTERPGYLDLEEWVKANALNLTPESILALNEFIRTRDIPVERAAKLRVELNLTDPSFTNGIALNDLDDFAIIHRSITAAPAAFRIATEQHYLARSAIADRAGVILLPTIAGIDEFARTFADDLAERGLTTLVWNPYPELPMDPPRSVSRVHAQRLKDAAALQRLIECCGVMEADLGIQTIGTIGFCMGGRFGLLLAAHEPRIRALVAVYPSIGTDNADELDAVAVAKEIACPVQLHYPGRDHVTSRAVFEALQNALQSRDADTTSSLYPNAEHGFLHKSSPANDAAARPARPQINAFLESHLRY